MTTQTVSQTDDLFFASTVGAYLINPRFVKRDWLMKEVVQRLADDDSPFVLLTAEPGFGKTAFMAQLAHDHPDWPRYFIRRDQREVLADVGARSFLLRIGYQLAARYPELFERGAIQLAVEQRIGDVQEKGEVVGAEVEKIIASPFYQGVIRVHQHIDNVSGRVLGLRIDELVSEPHRIDPVDLQHMALIDPACALQRLQPEQQIVILVDALDEVRYQPTTDNLLAWLTNCPALPSNVRFVLTTRPPDGDVQLFTEKQARRTQHLLLDDVPSNTFRSHIDHDVETYVDKMLTDPRLHIELEKQPGSVSHFRTEVIAKADGNIGYLDVLARGIDQAVKQNDTDTLQALLTLKSLPDHMQGLYAFFLHQIKQGIAKERLEIEDPETGESYDKAIWPAVHYRMLGVLAVAREPVSLEQIERLGGIKAEWNYLTAAAESFTPFLDVIEDRYRLYHATLPEFLTDTKTKSAHDTQDLYVNARQWNSRISNYYWRTCGSDWSGCDDYGLNNLALHLYKGEQFERLYELINCGYRQVKIKRTGSSVAFAEDVDLALSTLRDEPQINIVEWVRLCAAYARGISAAPPLVIDVLARSGQIVRAQWMAANITFAVDRCLAYTMLADACIRNDAIDEAHRMFEEAEKTLPAINEAHRTMALFWLVRTALLLRDTQSAQTLLEEGEKIAFTANSTTIDPWDLPNVLFWLAKIGELLQNETVLARIRHLVHTSQMAPVRNMVLQSMSVAKDIDGLSAEAQARLEHPDSSVRLANLALALAYAGLDGLCETLLAQIDAGAPDHGGENTTKRHVWARALLNRFDDAIKWAETIEDSEQKIVALSRIVEVAEARDNIAALNKAVDAALKLEQSESWRVLARLSSLLLHAGRTEKALALAEQVAHIDIPTTLANTLTFSGRKLGDDVAIIPINQLGENRDVPDEMNQKGDRRNRLLIPFKTMMVKTGPRATQTDDRAIADEVVAQQVIALLTEDKWSAADALLSTIKTPSIHARTLNKMATRAASQDERLMLWLRALDIARLAGWGQFIEIVDNGKHLDSFPDIEATVAEVSTW
jgi:tetratricopeptide (TPR) repeat protein